MTSEGKLLKKQKIRNTEYYNMQNVLDKLYEESGKGKKFKGLMEIVSCSENILLAYRNLKKNKGSNTAGIDGKTIKDISKWERNTLIKHIQTKLNWYIPNKILRVEIPKETGNGKRKLGIPTIMDRLIQQCILQVLEPICEAKFFKRSNGFRPNRSAENAISQAFRMAQRVNLHYVVDIDIKSFFDEVSHGKLIKQIWSLGIKDKKLICIISTMLKAEVANIGFQDKGTPQGGIISPLLSNIVLNELDWWIVSQWENIPTKHNYFTGIGSNGIPHRGTTFRALKKNSRLKECYIIRYADDAKVFCRNYSDAKKLFFAIKLWLKDRLGLEINSDKSRIVNLKNNYSEFLGFKLKVHKKGTKSNSVIRYVVKSHVRENALVKIRKRCKNIIKYLRQTYDVKREYELIQEYNSYIIGIHNYYCIATHVNLDFERIAFDVKKCLHNRLRHRIQKVGEIKNNYIKEKYGQSAQIRYINGHAIVPIAYVQHNNPMDKKAKINKYTMEGRESIHKNLSCVNTTILCKVMTTSCSKDRSTEYYDNRISVFVAQKGRCAITSILLEYDDLHCHHKISLHHGGNDSYNNLIIISSNVHKLIHANKEETVIKYKNILGLTKSQLKKVNKLRILANLNEINL